MPVETLLGLIGLGGAHIGATIPVCSHLRQESKYLSIGRSIAMR